ncbi:MAG: GHMP kinase [Spirochaetaceae bacterium]|nr:MAG: GHMP kinase [Spirochaetaceae bacterium]
MIIKTHAFPRAAVIGNPSDGYFGKTIAFTFSNFQADVTLYQTPEIEILPARRDHSKFRSLGELADDVRTYGYYGGIRLLKGALKKFHDYCAENKIEIDDRNFSIRYHSSIPAHLGLGGSSAIITAAMRALMAFYSVSIPKPALANVILSVETDELGISAGLQDRVAQTYQGIVMMDFNREDMERQGHGVYTPLSPKDVPNFYIAFNPRFAEGTEVFHNNLRYRFENGESAVVKAMAEFARLTDRFREALDAGDLDELDRIIDENFDLRRKIMALNPDHVALVETARKAGVSAKFTGSGGAIIGTYRDTETLARVTAALAERGATVMTPIIAY